MPSNGELDVRQPGETPWATLARLGLEYRTQEHTPQFIEQTWQNMLGAWIARAKEADPTLNVVVPTIPHYGRTQAQLEAMRERNIIRVYVPPFDYPTIARVFPAMRCDELATGRVNDYARTEGWYNVRFVFPHQGIGITERRLRDFITTGLEVGSAKTFIWLGQASHVLDEKGSYPGRDSYWFLVPNTHMGEDIVGVRFNSDGQLRVFNRWDPRLSSYYRGGLLQRK